jgi:hypothetical protein
VNLTCTKASQEILHEGYYNTSNSLRTSYFIYFSHLDTFKFITCFYQFKLGLLTQYPKRLDWFEVTFELLETPKEATTGREVACCPPFYWTKMGILGNNFELFKFSLYPFAIFQNILLHIEMLTPPIFSHKFLFSSTT